MIHTLIGIDHTLPFVVLGRAQRWSLRRTLTLTALCGSVHVLSSVVLGAIGIALGIGIGRLEGVESSRGMVAAWVLILFGLAYAGWSLARLRRAGGEVHRHPGGVVHAHRHGRSQHHHPAGEVQTSLTASSLFVIFLVGPCEPLIPILMIPAATMGTAAVVAVTATFAAVTIGLMLVLVSLGYYGMRLGRFGWLERHAGVVAGLAIAGSGIAIRLLGI